jgi:hypothetical protein
MTYELLICYALWLKFSKALVFEIFEYRFAERVIVTIGIELKVAKMFRSLAHFLARGA